MKVQWIIGALACAAAFGAQAQYKYIGPDGRVVYSDQPPPPTAKVLEKKVPTAPQSSGASDLPFGLQQAMKTAPVSLYTSGNCGAPCNDGRSLLTQRGIPFTEKTVNTQEDAAEFGKTINSKQLPVLTVGSTKLVQFASDQWNTALTAGGYPTSSQLPSGFRNPAPSALAQVAAPAAAAPGNQQAANPGAPSTAQSSGPASSDGGTKPSWFKGF